MANGDLDRVVLIVPDIEAAKEEVKRVLDIDLRVFYIESLKAHVGFCDEGLELVQPLDPDAPALKKAQGPLVSIGFRVPNLEEAQKRLEANGAELTSRVRTQSGMIELVFRNALLGLPVGICEYGEDVGFVEAIGAIDEYDPEFLPLVSD